MADRPAACPCTRAAVVLLEWECPSGHPGRALLCQDHGAVHAAALLSGGIMCGRCRAEGYERAVMLARVNGKRAGSRLGRVAP